MMWFYHKVPLDAAMKSHPLVVKEIGPLGEPPVVEVDEKTPEQEALIAMLREVSKVFRTRDIVEEYIACKCFPIREGWSVSSWAGKERRIGGLPMPNFSTCFQKSPRQDRKSLYFPVSILLEKVTSKIKHYLYLLMQRKRKKNLRLARSLERVPWTMEWKRGKEKRSWRMICNRPAFF